MSLEYLGQIVDYLIETGIRMYRISSDIAPYVTHPEMPQFHGQIAECRDELAALGARTRAADIRLSMHPSQYIVLNSPDEKIAAAAIADFVYHAEFLDGLGAGPEAKIITHAGGVYGDRAAAMRRFIDRHRALPEPVKARLVLENDEISYGVPDILAIHGETGIPLVFDILHHQVHNPGDLDVAVACRACLATWPADQTPKMHFSSQRQAEREVSRKTKSGTVTRSQPAKAGQHDDWIDAGDFLAFLTAMEGSRFDAMLEAKQKDLALFRLREALAARGMRDRIW